MRNNKAILGIFLCPVLNCMSPTLAEGQKVAPESPRADETATKINCVDPHACCEESKKVLEVLQLLTTAYAKGDLTTYQKYVDDNCVGIDEASGKVYHGKEAVLSKLQKNFAEHAPGGPSPLISFTIDQPYAKVTGDTCVVTFVAHKEIGGAHPAKKTSHVTDIFVKRGDTWKKLHWRGKWVKAK